MEAVGVCLMCPSPVRQPKTGRPKKYCSEACKQRAKRERRLHGRVPVSLDLDRRIPALETTPMELFGPRCEDPIGVVAECLVYAKITAAAFGVAAQLTNPQLAVKAERMAGMITAGLRDLFGDEQ